MVMELLRFARRALLMLLLLCAEWAVEAFSPTTKAQLNAAVLELVAGTTPGSYGGQDVSLWDVSGVEDMSYLFCVYGEYGDVCDYNKANFNGDISGWDVGQVTTM